MFMKLVLELIGSVIVVDDGARERQEGTDWTRKAEEESLSFRMTLSRREGVSTLYDVLTRTKRDPKRLCYVFFGHKGPDGAR